MENKYDLIEILKRFNRKERFFLVGKALGNEKFVIGNEFRKNLDNKLNLKIPKDAFGAMDYHLDWIDVSLKLWNSDINMKDVFFNEKNSNDIGQLNSNQEDIDFIIAFKSSGKYHIVLIEAKGETGWTNKQMHSKVERFKMIFREAGIKYKSLQTHFLLMSPKESNGLRTDDWPDWMTNNDKPNWLKLETENTFYKITRCRQNGKPDMKGEFCKIREITHD